MAQKARTACKYYKKGSDNACRSGDRCRFLHDSPDTITITPAERNKPCKWFVQGERIGPINVDDVLKALPGYCKLGDKCWFKHELPKEATNTEDDDDSCCICFEEPKLFGLLGLLHWRH